MQCLSIRIITVKSWSHDLKVAGLIPDWQSDHYQVINSQMGECLWTDHLGM